MNFRQYLYKLPWKTPPHEQLVTGLQAYLGNGDAVALFPYDDGTLYPKRAYFSKELLGGMGGYETDDGDKIVTDGEGQAVRQLFGVPVVLALDPTEHAAAVDLLKSHIAHRENIGEWIRVDKKGNVVQAGSAVEAVAADGGVDTPNMVTEFQDEYRENHQQDITFDAALTKLSEQGDVAKIYDIAPPATVREGEDGELEVEEATHIAVDQAEAADLIPTKFDTESINVALDKARLEEHEEGKLMTYFIYGLIAGSITVAIVGIIFFLLFQLGGA